MFEHIIKELTQFGIDDADARSYFVLLQGGPAAVGSLSQKLGLDRGKIYRSVKRLQSLGMITTTFSNPTVCTARHPSDALENLIQIKENELSTMQSLARKLTKQLHSVENKNNDESTPSLSIVQGRSNVYAKIAKLIDNAENLVFLVSTMDDLKRMHYTTISEKIKNAKKRGVSVILMSSFIESELPLLERLEPYAIGNVKLPSEGRMVVEKNTELIMSGSSEKIKSTNPNSDSVLHTNTSEMVKNIFSLCDLLWKKSSKHGELLTTQDYLEQPHQDL